MAAIDDAIGLWRGISYAGSGDWLDESGNSNDLDVSNATWDGDNDRFTFNGTAEYITAGDVDAFDFASDDDFTVGILCHVVSNASLDAVVTKKANSGIGAGWTMYQISSSRVRFGISDGSTFTFANQISFSTGTQVLFVGRRVVADDSIYMNVDTSEASVTDGTTSDLGNAVAMRIGTWDNGWFDGYVYALAIWDRALSDAEIAGLESELTTSSGITGSGAIAEPVDVVAGTGTVLDGGTYLEAQLTITQLDAGLTITSGDSTMNVTIQG